MMSQKKAPKYLKWFEFPFQLPFYIEYDGSFLGAFYYLPAAAEGSKQEAPIIIYQWLEIYNK